MFFQSWSDPWRVVLVAALVYPLVIVFQRVYGKRTPAKMNAFGLVVTVALGFALTAVQLSRDVFLAEGSAALIMLVVLQLAMSWMAVFERMGAAGIDALEQTIAHLKAQHPECVVILDAKRGDIDNTNIYYAQAVFDTLNADAVTVHPYMGRLSLAPFLERKDKGVIVMGANSSAGVGEFQDLLVGDCEIPLYEHVCRTVANDWNQARNCAVTAGATEPDKLARIRQAVGDVPILLLGLGAQGGDITQCLRVGRAQESFGLIANSSRAILYASPGHDFAEAAGAAAARLNQQLAAA